MPKGVYQRNRTKKKAQTKKEKKVQVEVVNSEDTLSFYDFFRRAQDLFEVQVASSERARVLSKLYEGLEEAENS